MELQKVGKTGSYITLNRKRYKYRHTMYTPCKRFQMGNFVSTFSKTTTYRFADI